MSTGGGRGALRALAALGLVVALATCRDGFSPANLVRGRVAAAPILPSQAALAEFGLVIDAVRFVVVRPAADTLADTTLALPPDATELALDLRVALVKSPDTLSVSVVALSGTIPLFAGTQLVPVPSPLPPTEIPVNAYIGPTADSIAIQPRTPFIRLNDSLRFQVQGFDAGVPVTQFYVAWSTSDSTVARISRFGVLRAPASRASVRVRARTPSGAGDSVTATFVPPATQLVPIAGGGQTDTVGSPLTTPLEVEARAADGLGVGGVAVRFRGLTGGGAVTDSLVVTDAAGRARTVASLGGTIGPQVFEARVAGLTGSPITFSATALAGAPVQLLAAAGDAQLAVVNTLLPVSPRVQVRDGGGNPVAGVPLTFTVASGGGSLSGGSQVSDSGGFATVGAWTLGTLAGTNSLIATGAGLSRTFTATGVAGPATLLVVSAGDLQSAVVGTVVATDPAVRAQDQYGNPVAGAAVTFAVSGGAGSVSGGAQLTNAAGVATVGGWTLDTIAGVNTLTASVSGVPPASFTATGLAGAARAIFKVAGDLQSAVVNTAVPTAPQVRIEDRFGNRVAGVSVSVAVDSGSGLVTNPAPVSDSAGVASVGSWQLGTRVGPNALTVSASGLAGSPVSFTATGLVGAASQMLAFAGDGQAALAGTPVSVAPAVRVSDQFGNAISGTAVTFTVGLGGGAVGLPATVSSDTAGVATSSGWTLGTAGQNTLGATATGLPTVTFTGEALASGATTIAHDAGTGQTGTAGTVLPLAYAVIVTDGVNPVAGVPVSWAVPPGSGAIAPTLDTTDAAGISTAVRTLGPAAGTQTATASVGGLTGSPVTFTATALPGAAAQFVKQSADPQTGTVATAVTAPVVKVTDQFGNGVSGVIVAFATGGGSVIGATRDTTDGVGVATPGTWTLGSIAGTNTVTATSAGLSAAVFTATGVAGPAVGLAFVTDPGRSLAGDTIEPAPRVAIQDQFGNTVLTAKDVVTLRLGATPDPAAKLLGAVDVAAVNGVAGFGDLAIDSAGVGYTLIATAASRTGAESKPFDIGGVIGAILVTRGPVAAALNVETKKLYVPGVTAVSVLLDDREVKQIQGFETAFGIAVNVATNQIYVSSLAGLVVIDGLSDVVRTSIPVGSRPRGVAVDEATTRIYVAATDPQRGGPALVPIDGSKDLVVQGDVVALPDSGMGVAFNPNDGFVYVAIPRQQEIVVIDPKAGGARVVGEIRNLGKGTYGVSVDVRANLLYVTNRGDNNVSVINPVDFKEIARLQVGRSPEGLGVDPDRGVVYVGNSGDGSLSLIDAVKLNVFATLLVGPAPKAAVVEPISGRVYVPTQQDDLVRVIQP